MKTAKSFGRARKTRDAGNRLSDLIQRATVPAAVFLVLVGLLGPVIWFAVFGTWSGKEYRGTEAREKVLFLLADHDLTGEVLDEVVGVRSTGGKDTAWYSAFRVKSASFEAVRAVLLEGRPSVGAVEVEEVEPVFFQHHWNSAPEWWCPPDDQRAVLHKVGYNLSNGVPSSGIDLAVIEEDRMIYVYRWSM
jgi:hypothetical protein